MIVVQPQMVRNDKREPAAAKHSHPDMRQPSLSVGLACHPRWTTLADASGLPPRWNDALFPCGVFDAAFVEEADLVAAAAVPIADDRFVAGAAELHLAILGVDAVVLVGVEDPGAVAVDADVGDAVAVPIADDRQIALGAKLGAAIDVR